MFYPALSTMPIHLPTGHYGEDIFTFAVPSSKMILVCVKLTKAESLASSMVHFLISSYRKDH